MTLRLHFLGPEPLKALPPLSPARPGPRPVAATSRRLILPDGKAHEIPFVWRPELAPGRASGARPSSERTSPPICSWVGLRLG